MTKKKTQTPRAPEDDAREAVRDYLDIRADYRYDGGIFSDEPERVARVKWIIDHRLTQVERTLILLYTDCLSTRKLGRRLHISHTLVAKEIRRIRGRILEEYENIKDNEHLF